MRTFLKGLGALALLVVILLLTAEGTGLAARHIGHQLFHGVDPTVSAAIVAAMSTVTVAIGTLVLGRIFERRKSIETEIRASKIPVYSRLVSGIFGILNATDDESRQTAASDLFVSITPDIITWASDDVLIAWSRFKRNITGNSEDQIFLLEAVLGAIRKDYGHKGLSIQEGDLLGLFITDIDELLSNRRRNARGRGRQVSASVRPSPTDSPAVPAPSEPRQSQP